MQAKMDEARVGHGEAAEKRATILTPRGGAKKQKSSLGCFLFESIAALSWRGA